MDVTVRHVDEAAYRALKAWAAEEGLPLGEAFSRIVREHVGTTRRARRPPPTFDFGPGTERLSEEVDDALYG